MSPMFPDSEPRAREGGGTHTFIQPTNLKGNSVITSYKAVIVQGEEGEEYRIVNPKNELLVSDTSEINTRTTEDEDNDSRPVRFQYVLAAPTSIATKAGEPSLTYINQGQSYKIKIKKLGDLSCHYRKKWLKSTIRICFHERRLQYIENEQISEWARVCSRP